MLLKNKIKSISIFLILLFALLYIFWMIQNSNTVESVDKINKPNLSSNVMLKDETIPDNADTEEVLQYPEPNNSNPTVIINQEDMDSNEIDILKELEKHKNDKGKMYEEELEQISTKQTIYLEKRVLPKPITEETLGIIEEEEGLSDTSTDKNTPLEDEGFDPR